MAAVSCEHCGLPFRVARVTPGRPVYCCSGCALAARVPVDAQGQFPVNGALVAALGVGFVAFNQVLFWLLALLLARDGQSETAGSLTLVSLGIGALVWMLVAGFQFSVGARRVLDLFVFGGGAAAVGWGCVAMEPLAALAGNAFIIAWSLRGLRRRAVGLS